MKWLTVAILLCGSCAGETPEVPLSPPSAEAHVRSARRLDVQLLDRSGQPWSGRISMRSRHSNDALTGTWDSAPMVVVIPVDVERPHARLGPEGLARQIVGKIRDGGRVRFNISKCGDVDLAVIGGDEQRGYFSGRPIRVRPIDGVPVEVRATLDEDDLGEVFVHGMLTADGLRRLWGSVYGRPDDEELREMARAISRAPWLPGISDTKLTVCWKDSGFPILQLGVRRPHAEAANHETLWAKPETPCVGRLPAGDFEVHAWNTPHLRKRTFGGDIFGSGNITAAAGQQTRWTIELDGGTALQIQYGDPEVDGSAPPNLFDHPAAGSVRLSIAYADGRVLPVLRNRNNGTSGNIYDFSSHWNLGWRHWTLPLPLGTATIRAEHANGEDVTEHPIVIERGKPIRIVLPAR